ncbi:glycosyltransferase family 4 protein [Streptomyces sp. NPDC059928]|uniref:glycosyltransferase family 4 protein n=1 Tax=unclassified Streptomyces TaxID=2593676 RepID=UPI00364A5A87
MYDPVYFLAPAGVDDPQRPSGGNRYDLELMRELGELGYPVKLTPVTGAWPRPSDADGRELTRLLEALPEGSTALWDGLIACGVPDIVQAASRRLRQVVIVHLPLADETGLDPQVARDLDQAERHALHFANATVATSRWTAAQITEHHGVPGVRVHVAPPGVHLAPSAPGTPSGGRHLLSVASLTPRKGHATLLAALAALPRDLAWQLKIAGAQPDATYTAHLHRLIAEADLTDRVSILGPLAGAELDAAYAWADLLVHASEKEPWGMVITEALARGLPVYASDVGGVPEAVGFAYFPSETTLERPGRLLPAGNSAAWTEALNEWMCNLLLRDRLRTLAEQRQRTLPTWRSAALEVAVALRGFPSTPWHTEPEAAPLATP